MLKKTMTYKDFNDQERTEDFYFHLSEAELAELELSSKGGFAEYIKEIVKTEDGEKLVALFKNMVLKAYGEKSPDGREFRKSKKIRRSFAQTNAYSQLFMLLSTDADEAAKFVNGIMPGDIQNRIAQTEKNPDREELVDRYRAKSGTSALISQEMADRSKELDSPITSQKHLEEMSREELMRLAALSQDNLRGPQGIME
jgi:hypothetical protein